MKIICTKDYEDMSQKAASLIAEQICRKADSVLGLATGGTPLGIYRNLAELHGSGQLDFSSVTSLNLDEYAGLAPEDSRSYAYFMEQNLFSHVNIRPEHCHIPSGLAKSADAECRRYNQLISALGGIDLQLLGLGNNGHIGFNEPADSFSLETNCVDLTESTINANKRFFASYDDVPKQAYTMGIKTIMQAKTVLVVVSGEDKAQIVKDAFFGPVTPKVPASILQLHKDVIVIADEAAMSLVK